MTTSPEIFLPEELNVIVPVARNKFVVRTAEKTPGVEEFIQTDQKAAFSPLSTALFTLFPFVGGRGGEASAHYGWLIVAKDLPMITHRPSHIEVSRRRNPLSVKDKKAPSPREALNTGGLLILDVGDVDSVLILTTIQEKL